MSWRGLGNWTSQIGQLDFAGLLQRCRDQGLLYAQMAAAADADLLSFIEREVGHGHALAHYSVFPLPVAGASVQRE